MIITAAIFAIISVLAMRMGFAEAERWQNGSAGREARERATYYAGVSAGLMIAAVGLTATWLIAWILSI